MKPSEARFQASVDLSGSGWVAGALLGPASTDASVSPHTAPSFFDVPGQPLKPRREEVDFWSAASEEQIARSGGVLPPEAIAEYRKALRGLPGAGTIERWDQSHPQPRPLPVEGDGVARRAGFGPSQAFARVCGFVRGYGAGVELTLNA